jgi:hypothetical protein
MPLGQWGQNAQKGEWGEIFKKRASRAKFPEMGQFHIISPSQKKIFLSICIYRQKAYESLSFRWAKVWLRLVVTASQIANAIVWQKQRKSIK